MMSGFTRRIETGSSSTKCVVPASSEHAVAKTAAKQRTGLARWLDTE